MFIDVWEMVPIVSLFMIVNRTLTATNKIEKVWPKPYSAKYVSDVITD